jgi:DNA-binding transcriptional LysR family regulator
MKGVSVLISQPDCVYASILQRAFGKPSAPLHTLQFGTIEGAKKAVAAGLGVSVLPHIAVKDLVATGELKVLPWQPSDPMFMYAMWYPEQCDEELLPPWLDVLKQVAAGWDSGLPS